MGESYDQSITARRSSIRYVASAMRQASANEKYLELQLSVFNTLIDSAIECTPITEAWIRELHARVCRDQNTYMVSAVDSIRERSLRKGNYKILPNHVVRKNGDIFLYAPVERIPAEMSKLCQELNSTSFLSTHPLLQASYAHYALVAIHPFSDSNGRVARALSLMYIYRANLIPTLDLVKARRVYLLSLKSDDEDDFQPFINLVQERAVDAINLTEEKIRAAV